MKLKWILLCLLLAVGLANATVKDDLIVEIDGLIATLSDPNDLAAWQDMRSIIVGMDAELFEPAPVAEAGATGVAGPPAPMMAMTANPTYVRTMYQCGWYTAILDQIVTQDNTNISHPNGTLTVNYDIDTIPLRIRVTPIKNNLGLPSDYDVVEWMDCDPSGAVEDSCRAGDYHRSMGGVHCPIYNVTDTSFSICNMWIDYPGEIDRFYYLNWFYSLYFWEAWYCEPITLGSDINGDGIVDLIDLSLLASEWLMEETTN